MSGSEGRLSGLALDPEVVASLEAVLPRMAERTVAAVIAEVPAYADPFSGQLGPNIEKAVQNALGAFLRLAIRAENTDSAPSLSPALDGAYELGRGEARNGRSIDVLLSAYRVGARVAWRELSATAVSAGLEAKTVARFAELVFAFIDELSASSVSGHADELATAGRVRQRYLDASPRSFSPASRPRRCRRVRSARTGLSRRRLPRCCCPPPEAADWRPSSAPKSCRPPRICRAWIPRSRGRSCSSPTWTVRDGRCCSRRWRAAALSSGPRALGFWSGPPMSVRSAPATCAPRVRPSSTPTSIWSRSCSVPTRMPLTTCDSVRWHRCTGLRANTAERLTETLRAWLLHQGQRDAIAADLFVHPQTVRYRMNQLRDLYGDRLNDPQTVLELTVALGLLPGN